MTRYGKRVYALNKKDNRQKKTALQRQIETDKALRLVQPVVVPLCDLFATCDSVFTEEGAFSDEHIKKSLGRIFRTWKETRAALDPEFNPSDYERRPRRAGQNPQSPLVTGSQKPSMVQRRTSEKNPKQSEKSERRTASRSAKGARSAGRASHGRS